MTRPANQTETPQKAALRLAVRDLRKGYVQQALHEYTTIDGSPLYWRLRWKHPGSGEKWIRPMMWDGSAYVLKEPEFSDGKPLYRLHEIASRLNETIYVVEGEHCADQLAEFDLLATTSGSADSAAKADWSPLQGRSVVIWPDNDDAGRRYADEVKSALETIGCAVSIIDVAALSLPPKGDIVDWLELRPDATAEMVTALPLLEMKPLTKPPGITSVALIRAADVKPEPIHWLWKDHIAKGKLAVLAGVGGTGKSTIAFSLAATVSSAGCWPDGTRLGEPGRVLIWSGEDDVATTIVPRLKAAGADLNQVAIIGGAVKPDGEMLPFDPSTDMAMLSRTVIDIGGAALLIVDPLVSAVSGDMHRANDVRRSLQALVDFAVTNDCAVLGISHFAKNSGGRSPADRVIGSQAFSALARTVLVAAKEDCSASRVLAIAKSNIGPDEDGIGYELEQVDIGDGIEATRVRWGDIIEGSASEILANAEGPRISNEDTTDDPAAALSLILKNGRLTKREAEKLMADNGYSSKQTRNAREKLNVVIDREGFGKDTKSYWSLADKPIRAQSSHSCPVKNMGTSEQQRHECSDEAESKNHSTEY